LLHAVSVGSIFIIHGFVYLPVSRSWNFFGITFSLSKEQGDLYFHEKNE